MNIGEDAWRGDGFRQVHPSEDYSNLGNGCTLQKESGKSEDPRYFNIAANSSFNVTEYTVQN